MYPWLLDACLTLWMLSHTLFYFLLLRSIHFSVLVPATKIIVEEEDDDE
jgi:hypothetical protein